MTLPLILDADGLDALADPRPPDVLRALLREAFDRDRDVLTPAVVCAELCRGPARTRALEAALARHRPGQGQRPTVTIVNTDLGLARQVGTVLMRSRRAARTSSTRMSSLCAPVVVAASS